MSKTKITLMSLILALALLIGIGCIPLFTDAAETESKIENSDFYQLGTGVSAVPSEKSTETDVILPYSGEGHLFFGESAEKAYPVDMAVFSWNIRISQLAVGQSFAVSFVKDTTKSLSRAQRAFLSCLPVRTRVLCCHTSWTRRTADSFRKW